MDSNSNGTNGKFSPARVKVTRGILTGVFSGEMRSGLRLVETELAGLFGVSRTPVREALGELAGVGLVGLKPNCGAIIREFGPDQVREIYEVRGVLEAEAARFACDRIPAALLDEFSDEFIDQLSHPSNGRPWARRVWESDCSLHESIAAHCGNSRLTEEIRRYGNFVQAIRETVGNRDRAQEGAIREHLDILKAMKRHDSTAAATAMRNHITIAGNAAVTAMVQSFNCKRRRNGVRAGK
jgi:DNA-binding GntR family transcriptional regulator